MEKLNSLLEIEKKHPWNVISEADFKIRIREIFDMLAEAVGNTVGPYGSSTMIEELGSHHMTKDGFTVLKNIHYNNRTDNTILQLILSISHQMVMKVGDGSTTAILAAHEFIEELSNSEVLKDFRPKDISRIIREYVELLCRDIQSKAKEIPEDEFVNVMTNIAKIATNDDETYTGFIHDIYEQSGKDTMITKRMSPTDKAYFRIMDDMFYISGKYIDKIYCNSENGAKCNLNNPFVLLFNFTLGNEHWPIVKIALNILASKYPSRRLLVVAPNYDQYFVDHIKNDAITFQTEYQKQSDGGAIPFPMVFARNPFFKSAEKLIYEDLGPFLGNSIINPLTADEFLKKIEEYMRIVSTYNRAKAEYEQAKMNCAMHDIDPETINIEVPEDDGTELYNELESDVLKYFGTCDKVSVGQDTIEFSGFNNKNQNLIDVHIMDAKDQLEKELNEIENLRYINKQYLDAKERLSRIACRSAMIYVGGNSDLEKKLNDDSLDDAIRACQSAATYGYNLGSNMAIFNALWNVDATELGLDKETADSLKECFISAFTKVILRIHRNKNEKTTIDQVNEIINTCIDKKKCYDLNTNEYSSEIINSCRTDIEILKGAISIVALILSANQYLAINIDNK